MTQRVNPQITQKIAELVQGMTNPQVRKALNNYMYEQWISALKTHHADPDDSAYFSVYRDLKNHIILQS